MGLFKTAKPHLASVKNYVPGKPLEELEREYGVKNAVKMASNENALGPSPKAVAAARKALSRVHRYPEGGCFYLRKRLAAQLRVEPGQLVFGNGSDEILVLAVRAFAGPDDEVITADPTFLIYGIAAQVEGARVVRVPMRNFRYHLGAMQSKINDRTRLIFIANPDNPVGTYVETKRLFAFLEAVPKHVVVVVDEAYFEFARVKKDYPDALSWLDRFPNLLVTRTFSKAYGLAGLRVGYGVSSGAIIAALEKVREPFNVNLVAQAAATAALDDKKFLKKSVATVNEGRSFLTKALEKMGMAVVDTVTNFVLFDIKRDAAPVYEKLLRAGVIVRPMGGWGLKTFLRVTIGKRADNKRFLKALGKALAVAVLAFSLGTAHADTLKHANGQSLEGVVTAEDDKQVTIRVEGMDITVPRSEVASLVRGPVEKKPKGPAPTPELVKQAAEGSAPGLEGVLPEAAARAVSLSALEKPMLLFDERKWKLDFQDARNNQVIAEFTLENENVENWTELVTAQLFIGLRTDPKHFTEYVRQKTSETCPQTRWELIHSEPNNILYAWSVEGCAGIPDQSEIARAYLGVDGLHVLHYAKKVSQLSEEERAEWVHNLEAAQFVKP